jgi:hypothetical protein
LWIDMFTSSFCPTRFGTSGRGLNKKRGAGFGVFLRR